MSATGTLVYIGSGDQTGARALVWVERDGREVPTGLPPRAYNYPRLSSAGTHAALDIRDQARDIWIWDLAGLDLRRFTFARGFEQYPAWSPDGEQVLFNTGFGSIVRRRTDGSGTPELLVEVRNQPIFELFVVSPGIELASAINSITPDGAVLIYRTDSRTTGHDLMTLSLEGEADPQPLIQTRFDELNAEISPDGRWVAYHSNESGSYEI